MTYLLTRIRSSIADPARFVDTEVVGFLSDGYIAACERSRCLRAWTTITLVAGTQEYALPADWLETMGVYQNGAPMDEQSTMLAPRQDPGALYYSYGSVIGFVRTPTAAGSAILHYARRPAALAAGDTPERQFGPEWYRLLYHYAAWHVYKLAYGAEKAGEAQRHRDLFDHGCAALERFSMSQGEAAQNTTAVPHILAISLETTSAR